MHPLKFLQKQYTSRRLLKQQTLDGYIRAVREISTPLGKWTAQVVTEYARREIDKGLAPHTVRGRCVVLMCVWRLAHEQGMAPCPPDKVAMPKCPRKIIRAIPAATLSTLLAHCEHLHGRLKRTQIPRSHYWSAFIAATYETALRTSDVRQLRWEPSGRWHLIQVKTGRPVTVDVGRRTLDLLERLSRSSPNLLEMGWNREWYCRGLQRVAGHLSLRICPQQLRQSAASEAERLRPGTAWILLGHSSPSTSQRWYIDSEHAYEHLPRPRIKWD